MRALHGTFVRKLQTPLDAEEGGGGEGKKKKGERQEEGERRGKRGKIYDISCLINLGFSVGHYQLVV